MSRGTSLVTLGLVVCIGGFLVAWRAGALNVTLGPNDQPTTQAAQTIRKLAQDAANAVSLGKSGSQGPRDVTVTTVPEQTAPSAPVAQKPPSFRPHFTALDITDTKATFRVANPVTATVDFYLTTHPTTKGARLVWEGMSASTGEVSITGLKPTTTYYLFAKAKLPNGQVVVSSDAEQFRTPLTWEQAENEALNRSYRINMTDNFSLFPHGVYGTGWRYGNVLITCYHVLLAGKDNEEFSDVGSNPHGAHHVAYDKTYDIAYMDLTPRMHEPSMQILPPSQMPLDAKVVETGWGYTWRYEDDTPTPFQHGRTSVNVQGIGIVHDVRESQEATIAGQSGGPVINEWGQVVGVVESNERAGGWVGSPSFFVSVDAIKHLGLQVHYDPIFETVPINGPAIA